MKDSCGAGDKEVGAHEDSVGVEYLDNNYQGLAIFDWEYCKVAQMRK